MIHHAKVMTSIFKYVRTLNLVIHCSTAHVMEFAQFYAVLLGTFGNKMYIIMNHNSGS